MHSICLSVSVFSVVFHVSLLFYKNLVQFVTLTELIDSIQGYSKRMECIHYYQMQLLQVFLSNKIEKCLYIWYVYLFLCLQSSKSCKYPSIVLKLINAIQVYYRMFCIGNGAYMTNGLCSGAHKRILVHSGLWAGIYKNAF